MAVPGEGGQRSNAPKVRKKRRPRPRTTVGPQGLKIQGPSPQRPRPTPRPSPPRTSVGPQGLKTQGTSTQKPTTIGRSNSRGRIKRTAEKQERQRIGLNPDRAQPNERRPTKKEIRAELVRNIIAERKRLGVPGKPNPSRSMADLSQEFRTQINTKTREGSSYLGLLHQKQHYDARTGKKIDPSPSNPRSPWSYAARDSEMAKATTAAPILKVLDQTTRPLHGIAGGVDAALHGRNVPKAFVRGIENKTKMSFGSVLRGVGVPKGVANVVGFGLNVAADPTTYLTLGTGSIARKEALRLAEKTEAKLATVAPEAAAGTRQQTTKEIRRQAERLRGGGPDAPTLAERAARRVGREDRGRGVTVRFAGHEVPGVRRGTAKVGRGVGKAVGNRKPVRGTRTAGRDLLADVNPNIVPKGLSKREYEEIRQRTRTARHSMSRGVYEAQLRARAIQKAVGKKNYEKVLDAIEGGEKEIRKLPKNLQDPARFLRREFGRIRKAEIRAGVKVPYRKNYVPHVRSSTLEEDSGQKAMGVASVGHRQVRPLSSKKRTVEGSLAELRQTHPGQYVEDPGVLFASRMAEGNSAAVRATFNRRLAETGRAVKRNAPLRDQLREGEAVFHIKGSDIREVKLNKEGRAELDRFIGGSSQRGGRYVVLNQKAVERALKTVVPGGDRSAFGLHYDKAMGVWKTAATQVNPGFHVRNFVGDFQNAFAATRGHRMPANAAHAARTLNQLGRDEKVLRNSLGVPLPAKRGVITRKTGFHTPKYGDIGYDRVAKELTRVGALRSGFQARELHDLLDPKGKVSGSQRAFAIKRWLNNREDIWRAATAIDALKKGATFEEAAARAARFHFDYSDLTEVERRVLRRIMPFYTWSARNIPLQGRILLTAPGKFAQYQKLREEFANYFGYQDDWEKDANQFEQRSAPLPFLLNGKPFTLSLGPSGLPITDLNELPVSANPITTASEWINRGLSLVTPVAKTPIELWANFSFFFRDQIERDTGPLVPAPAWVGSLPPKIRKDLGIVSDFRDPRSKKKQWGWPAKVGYAAGILPGPANFLNRVMTPSERADASTKNKVLGYMGFRLKSVDAVSTKITDLYDERAKLEKEMHAFNQRGFYADQSSPAYDRLRAKERQLNQEIARLKAARGDHIRKPKTAQKDPIQELNDQIRQATGVSDIDKEIREATGG